MSDTSVAQAFDELRADDGYRVRAEAFGAAFRNLPPLKHAVALIERAVRKDYLRQDDAAQILTKIRRAWPESSI